MRVLVTGANGFIGSHLTAKLIAAGHQVVGAVRSPESFRRRFPSAEAMACDLEQDLAPEPWITRLNGVDAVINCAGILQAARGQSIAAIHHLGPAALFDACSIAEVRRVIQISAISADPAAGTDYALSKHRGDEHLRSLDLDWIVLRPSLVYGSGSYGGTSLLRGLAALPWIVPLVGAGDQKFQPIHVDDLADAVLIALRRDDLARRTLDPTGPETLSLTQILGALRGWLGLAPPIFAPVPLVLVRLACKIGDLVGAGPLRSTALAQIEYGNTGDPSVFAAAIGFTPRAFATALSAHPAEEQDRWHARLYFMQPLLTALLVILWLASGAIGLSTPIETTQAVLQGLGAPASWAPAIGIATSLLDLAIAVALIRGAPSRLLAPIQLLVVLGYSLALTVAAPALWLDPFGSLLKNLPILGAILAWAALSARR